MKADVVLEVKRKRGRPRNPHKKVYVKTGKPGGRPSSYSSKISKRIIGRLLSGSGRSLTSICRDSDMPSLKTVYNWLNENHPSYQEDFLNSYKIARELQLDSIYGRILEIADDDSKIIFSKEAEKKLGRPLIKKIKRSVLSRQKIQIQSLKWLASRLQPRKYRNYKIFCEIDYL